MYYYSVTKKKSCSIDKTQKHYVEKKRQTQNVHEPIYVNIYKKKINVQWQNAEQLLAGVKNGGSGGA